MNTSTNSKETNISHIKSYVEFYYKSISETSDKVDGRLTGIIGFSSVLLKFADDLQGDTTLKLTLKVITCIFFLGAVLCCLLGVFPKASVTEDPRTFRETMYYVSNQEPEECERGISDSIMQAAESIRSVVVTKSKYLESAIWSLSLGSLTMALNIIVNNICNL